MITVVLIGLAMALGAIAQEEVEKKDIFTDSQRLEVKTAESSYWQAVSKMYEAQLQVKDALAQLNAGVENLKANCSASNGELSTDNNAIQCMVEESKDVANE